MQELKRIVAHNIATLRSKAHLTQFELGEKLRYSDKAVSRWERAEAVPDAYVLLMMAEIFGVTVDYLLKEHSDDEEAAAKTQRTEEQEVLVKKTDRGMITLLSFLSVWALAVLVFVITAIAGDPFWLSFIYAIPTSFVVLIVLNSVWGNRRMNMLYISVLVWGLLLSVYLSFLSYNLWMIFLIGIPAQIIIPIPFSIRRKAIVGEKKADRVSRRKRKANATNAVPTADETAE